MIPQPSPRPPRQFIVSRVWSCPSCGCLANSDISCVACPNCGHIELEGRKPRSDSFPKRLQTENQKITSNSALPSAGGQDVKTPAAGLPDPSTLFVPAAESNSEVVMKINSRLGSDSSVSFGEFPVGISVISKFYANQYTGRLVWEYCCRIPN